MLETRRKLKTGSERYNIILSAQMLPLQAVFPEAMKPENLASGQTSPRKWRAARRSNSTCYSLIQTSLPHHYIVFCVDHGLVHVGLSYPDGFTNPAQYVGTEAERRTLQEKISRLYAQATTGITNLLIADDKEPASDSIFLTVELPPMRDGAQVTKILRFPITSTDQTGSNNEYWPDDKGASEIDNEGASGSTKRFWSAGSEYSRSEYGMWLRAGNQDKLEGTHRA